MNYELARKLLKKKVQKDKINEDFISEQSDLMTKAACYALLDQADKAYHYVKLAINKDFTQKFHFHNWVVFDNIRKDEKFHEFEN